MKEAPLNWVINKCANGFVTWPDRVCGEILMEDRFVFETWEGLVKHLNEQLNSNKKKEIS